MSKAVAPDTGCGYDLAISSARAFALITMADELRHWFAEDVEIDASLGGQFRFAGRGAYVPVATVLERFEAGHLIAWRWPVHGVDVTVTLTVTPKDDPDTCRIDVSCTMPHPPQIPRGRELIDDLWRFQLANLKTYSEGGPGVFLPDYSDPTPEVRQTILVNAPRASVFRALLDPELLKQWCGGEAVVEPRIGGQYVYGWSYEVDGKQVAGGPTQIVELIENERLVTDWPDWRGDESNAGQKITWLLADEGAGSSLTLIHHGFSRAADVSDYSFGWACFASEIKRVAEAAG